MQEESKAFVIFKRFIRGFIAGGLSSVVPQLTGLLAVTDLSTIQRAFIPLSVGFVVGGLLAIEKLVRWVEPEEPVEIEETPEAKTAARKKK